MEFLMAIAAGLAIVALGLLVRLGRQLGCCLATLVVGVVFGYDFFHVGVVTFDRLLLAVTALVCGVQLTKTTQPWPALAKADLWLLLLMGYLALSTWTHDWRYHGAAPVAQLLFFYFLPVVAYGVARCQTPGERPFTALLAVLSLLGCYLAATAVAEVQGWRGLVFPRYISDPRFAEFLGRGRGPLLNPVGNGWWMAAALASALLLGVRCRLAGRWIVAGSVPVLLAGCYATLTRTVWMGAAGVILAMAWLQIPRRLRFPVVGSAILAGMLVVAGSWHHLMAFKRDKFVSASEMAESAELRPILAAIAWNMFLERPLVGFGFGQYPQRHQDFINERTFGLPLEKGGPYIQHNVFLAHLADGGLIGMGLFCLLLGQWGWDAWVLAHDRRRPPCQYQLGQLFVLIMAAYLPNGLFHEMNVIPMTNMLLFFLAGLMVRAKQGDAEAVDGDLVSESQKTGTLDRPAHGVLARQGA